MKPIFDGLKVLELGTMVSAPFCAELLADLGAEVIKIERPGVGDRARTYGPFPNDIPDPEKSGLFLWLNRNKLGITLDVGTRDGWKILEKLVEVTDVIVENLPPSIAEKLGITYDVIEELNKQAILTSVTPYGLTGPYRDYKGHHINICAAGGVSIGIGAPDRKPLELPMFQAWYQAALNAASATVVALIARDKTGEGQQVDISESEVLGTAFTGRYMMTYIYRGITGIRRGKHAGYFLYPSTVLPCRDGYVSLQAPQIGQWTRFIDEVLGTPEWSKLPRYRNRRAMIEDYPDEVDNLLLPWFQERTREEIADICRQREIPFAPVKTVDEVMDYKQFQARNVFVDIEHPRAGTLKYVVEPCKFSGVPPVELRTAPLLGQHNEEVFCNRLGLSREELVCLAANGVI